MKSMGRMIKIWRFTRLSDVGEEASNSAVSSAQPLAEGRGKRTKISNKWYMVKSFICHNDDDDWRVDI